MALTKLRGVQIADNSVTAEDIEYSLDDAYDNGGSGVGRSITADAGAVIINATSDIASALVVTGTVTATGEIISMGKLRSDNSSGDEGGEILLNKPVTNTTLVGVGVTIDVYQNKIRFFEQGGTARGYYLDITNGGGAASTNLGAAGGSPGGSDSHIQFNDGGSFGGQSTFRFDKTSGVVTANRLLITGTVGGSIVTSGAIQVKDSGGAIVANVSELGTISGSGDLQVGGNITGSNLRLSGDLAVVGGDITTTATNFNFINSTATTINFGQGATAVNIGSGSSVVSVGQDLNIGGGGNKLRLGSAQQLTMLWNTNAALVNTSGQLLIQQQAVNARLETQISGTTAAGMFRVRNFTTNSSTFRDLFEVRADGSIMIGSASSGGAGLANTTINNDLLLGTGILAVSADATPIQLISSGNVTVKLDVNNNATGHYFNVVDYNGVDQFKVTETGDISNAGTLTLGSSVGTNTILGKTAFNQGISGSLTKLSDGTTDYLAAGSGISLVTGSNGNVTISTNSSYITSVSWLVG